MIRWLLRPLCWLGWHKWKYTLAFKEEPDYSMPCGMHYGSNHYMGECVRCGTRDLFRGPYTSDDEHPG